MKIWICSFLSRFHSRCAASQKSAYLASLNRKLLHSDNKTGENMKLWDTDIKLLLLLTDRAGAQFPWVTQVDLVDWLVIISSNN
jgi:hypothetical protein